MKHEITISNPDRILFPKVKITKGEMVAYYKAIAPLMLPLVKSHLLTLQRFPLGITKEGFFQKDAGDYFPSWIKRKKVAHTNDTVNYVVAANEETFVYLANQGTITFHAWLSRADKLKYPDRIVFDLDPSGHDFNQIRFAALDLKMLLDHFKIDSFVMTTGSRGLHVVVPIKRLYTFEQTAHAAEYCAQQLLAENPKRYTLELKKAKRGNRIFIDTLRNRWSATSVVPYSVRPKKGAPVALPLSWNEVKSKTLKPDGMTIAEIKKILRRKTEWEDFVQTLNGLKGIIRDIK